MIENEIPIHTDDGEMTTLVVRPDADGPFPVAMLYIDGIGYREQVKENARRFASAGYFCAAPDLYYRTGRGMTFDMTKLMSEGPKGPEAERMLATATSVKPERVVADTTAVLAAIASDPAASSGPRVCVGYCVGARLALHVASALAGEFVAAAAIHPGSADHRQAGLAPPRPHWSTRRALLRIRRKRSNGHPGANRSVPR